MTVSELMRYNFDQIFIELDPARREAMMREVYTEDCVWIHPGGRIVGIEAINDSVSEIRKRIPEYRYSVVGEIQTMHTVGICRWGSGPSGEPFVYAGTDVVEARDGRVAVFYTFIDSGTPPVLTEAGAHGEAGQFWMVGPVCYLRHRFSTRTPIQQPVRSTLNRR